MVKAEGACRAKCPRSVRWTATGHCGSDHVEVREVGISKCMEREVVGGRCGVEGVGVFSDLLFV